MTSTRERLQAYTNKSKEPQSFEHGREVVGARIGEAILGAPGNLKKGLGQSFSQLNEEFNLPPYDPSGLGQYEEGSVGESIFNPPTSHELRKGKTKEYAQQTKGNPEYYEPRGNIEEAAGEFAQDVTNMFLPGTRGFGLLTRLGAPLVSNAAKFLTKKLSGDEKLAENVKQGTSLIATIAGLSNPMQMAQQRISQSRQIVPETAAFNAQNLANNFMPLYTKLNRGFRNIPSKSKLRSNLDDFASQIQPGNQMSTHSLMDAVDNINELINEAKGFDIPKATRPQMLKNLNEAKTVLRKEVRDQLKQYPEALELYNTGYEAAAVMHRSEAINNALEKYAGKKLASIGLKVLFPALAGAGKLINGGFLFGPGLGATYKTGQILYRVANSPTLARYYQNIIRRAEVGNIAAMSKSITSFDKGIDAQEKKDKSLDNFKAKIKNRTNQ